MPVPPPAPTPPPPVAPTAAPKNRTRLVRIIGGIVVAVVVLALKFGAIAGIVHIFKGDKHKAKEAEAVVNTFAQASDSSADNLLVGGKFVGVIDVACATKLGNTSVDARYVIEKSEKDGATGADVYVRIDHNGPNVLFHLTDASGSWLIDKISCP